MSGLEIGLTVALAVVFALALYFGLRLRQANADAVVREQHWMEQVDDAEVAHRDLHSEVLAIAQNPWTRYEVVLADWGPDFTGEGDTLPRWRWAVLDADRAVKHALGLLSAGDMGTEEMPFMLGNEGSAEMALAAAFGWVEERENPVLSVGVGEVTPWRAAH